MGTYLCIFGASLKVPNILSSERLFWAMVTGYWLFVQEMSSDTTQESTYLQIPNKFFIKYQQILHQVPTNPYSNTNKSKPQIPNKSFWLNFLKILAAATFCQKALMAQLWWWMEVSNKLFENCAKEKHIKEKHIKRLQVSQNVLILALEPALIYTSKYEHKMSKFWHYPSWNVVLLSKAFHQKLLFCTFDIFFVHLSQYALLGRLWHRNTKYV